MVDRHHPGKAPTAVLTKLASGQCLTIDQLAVELDLTHRQVSDAAAKLFKRDYLERKAVGCYQLTDAGEAAAITGEIITSGPRGPIEKTRFKRNTFRHRAWIAMRIRRRFTVPDLIADASKVSDGNPADNLQRYLRGLKKVGYVAELPNREEGTAITSNGFKRWMLLRDTGPKAPVILKEPRGIHDFNLGKDVPCLPR